MSFIQLEYRRHMWQVPICIYPSQFPDLSRHKSLTSMLHLPLMCREQVVALPQVIHMPQFRDSAHEITIPCRAGNTFILRKNTDVQPCPWTHRSLVCFGKWCWLSFWRGVGFFGTHRCNSRSGSGWLSPWKRKMWTPCSCSSWLFFAKEMSLQDKQERRGKAQVTDSQSSAICAKILIQQ